MLHRGPGAAASLRSAVTRSAANAPASAIETASWGVTLARSSIARPSSPTVGYRTRGSLTRASTATSRRRSVRSPAIHLFRSTADASTLARSGTATPRASRISLRAAGDLHAGFAIPAGVGDIATGIAALFLLAALLNGTMTRRNLVAFTTLGVADFVVAVITGALIRPDGHEQLPWILFPTLAVPFFSIVHLVNWTQLSSLAAPAAPRRETGGRLGRRSGNLRTVESRVS